MKEHNFLQLRAGTLRAFMHTHSVLHFALLQFGDPDALLPSAIDAPRGVYERTHTHTVALRFTHTHTHTRARAHTHTHRHTHSPSLEQQPQHFVVFVCFAYAEVLDVCIGSRENSAIRFAFLVCVHCTGLLDVCIWFREVAMCMLSMPPAINTQESIVNIQSQTRKSCNSNEHPQE